MLLTEAPKSTASKAKASHQNRKTCGSVEYYTPEWLLAAARETLGAIDLDPASCPAANQAVKARRFYDCYMIRSSRTYNPEAKDGLMEPWGNPYDPQALFLNYPSNAKDWWVKLLEERKLGHLKDAIVLAYSADPIFSTQEGCGIGMASFPMCLLRKRVAYLTDTQGRLKPKSGTPCHSAVIYVPSLRDNSDGFYQAFRAFGQVVRPYRGEEV